MSQNMSVSIGSIRKAAARHYNSTGQKLNFHQAVQMAYARKLMQPQYRPKNNDVLSLEEFWKFIEGIPLVGLKEKEQKQPECVPEYFGNFYLREENAFIGDDDIMAHIHVPYIYDGTHTHDHFEINYVYYGQCTLQFGDREEILGEGSFFVLAPDSPHNVFDEGDSIIISVIVRKSTFDTVFATFLRTRDALAQFFKDSMYQSKYRGCLIFNTCDSAAIRKYMQNLMLEFYMDDCYHNINAVCMLSLIFSHIVRTNPDYSIYCDFSDSSLGNLNFAVLIQYIKQNYNTVNLSALSAHFHYSESFLSRLIQKKTGENFSTILKRIKMEHAKSLLESSDLSVKDISDLVGYESPNHFGRVFKRYYGITPAAFKKTVQSEDIWE